MKTLNIAKRIILQTVNDKRSLALILIAPLFIITLIYFLLGESGYKPNIGQSGIPSAIVDKITQQDVTVSNFTISGGKDAVKAKKIDAFLYKDGSRMILLFETNDAVKTGIVQKSITAALKELSLGTILQTDYVYGKSDDSLFNSLGYIMLGIVSFFIVFIIAGVSFVRERTNQTMERLMMTPVRRWQVVLGYTLGFGLFAVIQSILLLGYVKWVLGMAIAGSVLTAAMIMIFLALSAVCIGAFFSIFSNNEFQVIQFIPIIVIPQIFFSGLISLDTLPYHLGVLSKIMPVYYACDALKTVMIRGEGIAAIAPDLFALFLFISLFFIMNCLALKKYRKI